MISPSTICYALKMTYDFLRSEYLCERTECNRKRLEEFSDAIEEIDDGKFEIEGYERAQWTKFNPNDPKTFPPIATQVLFCEVCFDVRDRELRKIISAGWHNPQNHLFWKGQIPVKHEDVTHWRPLPTPPGKEDAK